ncbi:hypothetical protein IH992_06510 [Candidatus Poribacteria bacterium]|nr:hypothetical protein [Candidatus Poribacteria bacterium]
MANRDTRLSVIIGADLPAGWMGKSWALHQGIGHAQGEWLLFTDFRPRLEANHMARERTG